MDGEPLVSEEFAVWLKRRHEALQAGMDEADAERFASSDIDIGMLRRLVEKGCPRERIAEIVL